MTHILVTGGAGYIGSHACKALSQAGYTPVTYDNLVFGHEWAVNWGPLECGDVRDRSRLDQVFRRYRPDAVLHFAGFAYVGESVTDPGKYYSNNVIGGLTLLETMRDHGVDKIVFSSTCSIYGVPKTVPIPEDHPREPINPYGASKLIVERMLADFEVAHGLRSVSLRYFNGAGADREAEIGESHDPETHLIPLVLDVAAGRSAEVTVFGTDYDTPDGTCIRDYVHVTDLAGAHVKALEALREGHPSAAYNLGTGQGASVQEVIETVRQVTGHQVPVLNGDRRAGDPPKLVSDPTKARSELGWQPQLTKLETIVETAWAWHQKLVSIEADRVPAVADSELVSGNV